MKILTLTCALGAAALMSGCVVVPSQRAYRPAYDRPAYAEPSGVYVDAAPPPPYAEVVPVLPYAGAVWIGGYWGWNGGRHNWVPGYWERPRAGYRYEPHRWEPYQGRWHLRIGGWARL